MGEDAIKFKISLPCPKNFPSPHKLCMKKITGLFLMISLCLGVNAQVAVTKYVGKDSKKYGLGYGLFLKGGYSFNGIDDVTLEAGVNIFTDKEDSRYGIFNIPVKLGYRFFLNRKDHGFYVEPQVGYNVYGGYSAYSDTSYESIDITYTGLVLSPGVGYQFGGSGGFQPNLEFRYDINLTPSGPYSWLSLRLTQNFTFGKKD